MKPRSFFTVTAIASGIALPGVLACATDVQAIYEAPVSSAPVPEPVVDASVDGSVAVDADTCADCEQFPEVCTPDALCPAGLFDANAPKGGQRSFPLSTMINAIASRGPNDVWVAGAVGNIARFDGTSWAASDLGTQESMELFWLQDSGELVFGASVLRHFLHGLDAHSGSTVTPMAGGWNAASLPAAQFRNFRTVTTVTGLSTAPGAEWTWLSMWATSTTGLSRMRRSSSGTIEIQPQVPAAISYKGDVVFGVHGHSPEVVWAVGARGLAFRLTGADGASPALDAVNDVFETQTGNNLNGIWAPSDADAWAVGAGTIAHYTAGTPLAERVEGIPADVTLHAVHGTSSSDIWAVGDEAVVYHYDGTAWSRVKVAGLGVRRPDLRAVHAIAPGTVWIGGRGIILSLGGGK